MRSIQLHLYIRVQILLERAYDVFEVRFVSDLAAVAETDAPCSVWTAGLRAVVV